MRHLVLFLAASSSLAIAMPKAAKEARASCVQAIISEQGSVTPHSSLIWLARVRRLNTLAELKEFLSIFHNLPAEEKVKVREQVLQQYSGDVEKKNEDEYGLDLPEQRVLQSILASEIHNPRDLWEQNKFKDARSFLGEFLKQRGASYTANDILRVAKELQNFLKGNQKFSKIVWAGSFPSGLGKLGFSDLDLIVQTSDNNPFDIVALKTFYKVIPKNLKNQNLDAFVEGGISVHPSSMLPFYTGGSRIMIEVYPDKVFLKLYSSENTWTQHAVIASGEPLILEVK